MRCITRRAAGGLPATVHPAFPAGRRRLTLPALCARRQWVLRSIAWARAAAPGRGERPVGCVRGDGRERELRHARRRPRRRVLAADCRHIARSPLAESPALCLEGDGPVAGTQGHNLTSRQTAETRAAAQWGSVGAAQALFETLSAALIIQRALGAEFRGLGRSRPGGRVHTSFVDNLLQGSAGLGWRPRGARRTRATLGRPVPQVGRPRHASAMAAVIRTKPLCELCAWEADDAAWQGLGELVPVPRQGIARG